MKLNEPQSLDDWEVRHTTFNDSALHTAIAAPTTDTAAFAALIAAHKTQIDTPGVVGLPPLHLAAHLRRVDLAALLLDAGADVGAASAYPDESKLSPLHFAAKAGELGLVELLVARGANASAVASIGNTPLHMAAAFGVGAEVVQRLLDAGARVDAQDLEGYTALHLSVYAAANSNTAAAALAQIRAISKHCDATCAALESNAKMTALQIAEERGLGSEFIAALKEMSNGADLKSEL
jgi:ankyrin repeat protein